MPWILNDLSVPYAEYTHEKFAKTNLPVWGKRRILISSMQCCGSALVQCGSGSGPRVLMTKNFKEFADEQKFIFFDQNCKERELKILNL